MSQLVRGIWWRRAHALTLLALGTVVIAGCLVSVTFSELTDTEPGSAGILLVLGVVALSVQAAAAARARRHEIALAQIRGRHGARLFTYYLAEPITILVIATGLGVLLGTWVTRVAADAWLGADTEVKISGSGWTAVAVAAAASLAAVIAGSWRTVREPLIGQLDDSHRPKQAPAIVLFGQTVVIVAAAVAAYQASNNEGSREGVAGLANPALLSPILLGLAAGQVAVWGIQAAASWQARRSGSGGRLATFLAVRRLGRRSDTVFGTRLVIAAAVVGAVTASATTAVASWQDETTRLALGGPRQFSVEKGGLAAYEAAHRVDPEGEWLMAMVSAPDDSLPYRRVFADTERWDTVVGDFLTSTGAAGVTARVTALSAGNGVQAATGGTATVELNNASLQELSRVKLTLLYVNDSGSIAPVFLKAPQNPPSHGTTRVSTKLEGCAQGCVATQLVFDGSRPDRSEDVLAVTRLDFGGVDLLAADRWGVARDDRVFGDATQRGRTLFVAFSEYGDRISVKAASSRQTLAAVTTVGFMPDRQAKAPIAYAVDGSEHPVEVVGTAPGLPFVGRQGMLLDLSRALAFSGTTIPDADAYVVARSDTPESVLNDLEATGVVGESRSFTTSLDSARQRADAQGVHLYTLMSIFAAAIAAIGLAASVAGQRGERQREAASLRVSGVRSRHIRAAHRKEASWLGICAFVVVGLTGWLASRLTLEGLALVPQSPYSARLTAEPSLPVLIAVAAAAGALVGVVTLFANRHIARRSPPSMLRDEVGG